MPVGSNGKKVVSVEPVFHDDEIVGGTGAGSSVSNNYAYDEPNDDDNLNIMDRPIKANNQLDYAAAAAAATAGEDPDADPLNATGMPLENFAPGQHPLEGVPNLANLPTPEQLTIKSRYVIYSSDIHSSVLMHVLIFFRLQRICGLYRHHSRVW